jgi:hypothetical protein
MRNNLRKWQNEVPYFVIPKAEQKNNTAVDSVYINVSDDFYEITVDRITVLILNLYR